MLAAWGTGLRIRFFLTILAVLLFVSVSVVLLHATLLQQERLYLIDQQLRATASTLVDSELGDLRKINFKRTESIISEELGESRLGKFFVVRNSAGETIFESSNVRDLSIDDIPTDKLWNTIKSPTSFIRVLNLKLPRFPDRTLQVGFVLNNEIIIPNYFNTSTIIILVAVLTVGSLASLFLTSFLLKPVARLSEFIRISSEKLKTEQILPNVPTEISAISFINSERLKQSDEYQNLVLGFNILIDRVNKHYKNSKLWAYQMAHELKTPLTLISLETEALEKNLADKTKTQSIRTELQKIAGTVSSFLSWAELDNSTLNRHLFANKLGVIIRDVLQRLDPKNQSFDLHEKEEIRVLCNPAHLEQLVINLLTNAMNHNSRSEKIQITIEENSLVVKDSGPGIPESVLERMGEPFNKGSSSGGSGLGLAWINSLCRLYGWSLKVENQSLGVQISISFVS